MVNKRGKKRKIPNQLEIPAVLSDSGEGEKLEQIPLSYGPVSQRTDPDPDPAIIKQK
jgi:hypothetical protein